MRERMCVKWPLVRCKICKFKLKLELKSYPFQTHKKEMLETTKKKKNKNYKDMG